MSPLVLRIRQGNNVFVAFINLPPTFNINQPYTGEVGVASFPTDQKEPLSLGMQQLLHEIGEELTHDSTSR